MLSVTTITFLLGIGVLVLDVSLNLQQMVLTLNPPGGGIWSTRLVDIIVAVGSVMIRIIFIMSDVICAWRAMVLWNRDRRVVAVLLLFLLGTVAAAGCDLGLDLVPLFNPSHHSAHDDSAVKRGERALIMIGPTLATNILSTSLIAWKAWSHRRSVRKHLGEGNTSQRVERILALLIESGFVYCCIWILYLVSAFRVLPQVGFDVMDTVIPFAAGVYAPMIVILVCIQRSPVQHYSTFSTGMQFATPPPMSESHKSNVTNEHVYSIRPRDYMADSDPEVPSSLSTKGF
ncbi:hypothetical protein BC834DRAFT_904275 [Gloeopeniophorella convolvens]|nr:hypothetical protein BC834DRAFT_904275 [Gloeopeniophorella convolvens]